MQLQGLYGPCSKWHLDLPQSILTEPWQSTNFPVLQALNLRNHVCACNTLQEHFFDFLWGFHRCSVLLLQLFSRYPDTLHPEQSIASDDFLTLRIDQELQVVLLLRSYSSYVRVVKVQTRGRMFRESNRGMMCAQEDSNYVWSLRTCAAREYSQRGLERAVLYLE